MHRKSLIIRKKYLLYSVSQSIFTACNQLYAWMIELWMSDIAGR